MIPRAAKAKRKLRWYQLSLRTLLLLTLLAGCGFRWLAYERGRVQNREAAIAQIEKLGGKIKYSSEPFRSPWLRIVRGVNLPDKEVVHVSLTGDQITDFQAAKVAGLTRLERLHLNDTAVTDIGLSQISGLTKLELLSLSNTRVTDSGLIHLAGLAKLRWLNLADTQVSDAGLVHLAGLASLERLSLSGARVSDAGLAQLSGLANLEELLLDGTQVTDAGLVHLAGLRKLTDLHLDGTGVTAEGVRTLRRSLPHTMIVLQAAVSRSLE